MFPSIWLVRSDFCIVWISSCLLTRVGGSTFMVALNFIPALWNILFISGMTDSDNMGEVTHGSKNFPFTSILTPVIM